MTPISPSGERKARKFSPSRRRRSGAPPASTSDGRKAGIQYCRISRPIAVSGPVRVSSSFSSARIRLSPQRNRLSSDLIVLHLRSYWKGLRAVKRVPVAVRRELVGERSRLIGTVYLSYTSERPEQGPGPRGDFLRQWLLPVPSSARSVRNRSPRAS